MAWGGRRVGTLRARVVELYGWTCHLCPGVCLDPREVGPLHPLALTLDHVVPRSRGGSDTVENLRPAHRRCNLARGAGPIVRAAAPPEPPRRVRDAARFFD